MHFTVKRKQLSEGRSVYLLNFARVAKYMRCMSRPAFRGISNHEVIDCTTWMCCVVILNAIGSHPRITITFCSCTFNYSDCAIEISLAYWLYARPDYLPKLYRTRSFTPIQIEFISFSDSILALGRLLLGLIYILPK